MLPSKLYSVDDLKHSNLFIVIFLFNLQAYLIDVVDFVLDHYNKVNIAMKQVTCIFWFSSVYKSYVCTILSSLSVISKKMYIP